MTGLVLAGGRSHRMGADKATLRVGGRRLVDRAVVLLRGCCDEVLVASGDGRRLDDLPGGRPGGPGVVQVVQVPDAVPGAGPLGGVLAGLETAAHPLVAVLAVDMPFADAAVLRLLARLLAERRSGEAVVVPLADGRLQPLHAVWARNAAPALRALLATGERSATAAARRLGARVVEPAEWAPVARTAVFAANVNEPADLAILDPAAPREAEGSPGQVR